MSYSTTIFFAISSCVLAAISFQTTSGVSETNNSTCLNFYHQYGPVNDRRVFRIFHDGILALKVVRDDVRGSVVQQTDGSSLVTAIYRGGQQEEHLTVCNVVDEETEIQRFMQRFSGRLNSAPDLWQCVSVEQIVKTFGGTVVGPTVENVNLVPQDMASVMKQCQRMQPNFEHTKLHQHHNGNDLDSSEEDKPAIERGGRQRRLVMDGTKWCGIGDVADGPGDYGIFREADKCCEKHDHCSPFISAWDTKYDIKNMRSWPILHCDCDDQLYWCLENVRGDSEQTGGAALIRDTYFNLLGPPCFTLKQVDVEKCLLYVWCNTETKTVGELHDNRYY